MKLKKYLNEYTIIKSVTPKPDKKTWKLLDSYTANKLKKHLKKEKISIDRVWRILGSYQSHNFNNEKQITNFNNEKQITVNFETTDMGNHSVTINLKTGEVYKE